MVVDYWHNAGLLYWFFEGRGSSGSTARQLGSGKRNEGPISVVSLALHYLLATEIRNFAFLL